MGLREMRYITTVADYKNVTAAAKKLFISQPSLSHIIAKVEEEAGVKLFERRGSSFQLTYAGERYVDTARKILLLNDNLFGELKDIGRGEKGVIHFGIPTERAGYMLPKVIQEFRRQFPAAEVQISEAKEDELYNALMRSQIKIFVAPGEVHEKFGSVKAELIYKERLFLVAGEAMAADYVVDLKQIKDQPFILLKKGHAIRRKADEILKNNGIQPNIFMEVSSCISAVLLAAAGLGVTIVPERAVDVLGGAKNFCCHQYGPEPDTWDIQVIYRKDVYLDRIERGFIKVMKEIWNDEKGDSF